jgi:tetratricopeptide (TPR) repeat protein
MCSKNGIALALVVTHLLFVVAFLTAQVPVDRTGSVLGTIRTDDNRPVPNARVELSSVMGSQAVAVDYTNSDGSFNMTNLPFGTYQVRVTTGLLETEDRIQVQPGQNSLNLRVATGQNDKAGANQGSAGDKSTVSIKQLQVPAKSASLVEKARELMSKGKIPEASQLISQALAIFPNNAEALTLRAVLELDSKQTEQASADAEKALQTDPNYPMAYVVMGSVRNIQANYSDSIKMLERGIALAPAMWQAYFEYSKALLLTGKFQEALHQADKALSLVPHEYPSLHLVRAYAFLGLKLYSAATPELEIYLRAVPQGPNATEARSALQKVRTLATATR